VTDVDLTKWPRLLVVGEPVTHEQANDILVRTNLWMPCTNDRAWGHDIAVVLAEHGGPVPSGLWGSWTGLREWNAHIRALDLHYLHNDRIASAWIGGPHGWCDWDGTIGCTSYNIGKWPTVEAVTDDWQAIAAAWPFLDLRAQLVPDEGEAGASSWEWLVNGGRVETVADPGALIAEPTDPDFQVWNPERERGVSLDRLREAVAQVVSEPDRSHR
jgi:hypothetical protein